MPGVKKGSGIGAAAPFPERGLDNGPSPDRFAGEVHIFNKIAGACRGSGWRLSSRQSCAYFLFQRSLVSVFTRYKVIEIIRGKNIFINADLALIYKSESSHWDMLKFDMAICPSGQSGFDLYFRVTNERTGQETAVAKMGMLFFDYELRKTSKVPEEFKVVFSEDFQ